MSRAGFESATLAFIPSVLASRLLAKKKIHFYQSNFHIIIPRKKISRTGFEPATSALIPNVLSSQLLAKKVHLYLCHFHIITPRKKNVSHWVLTRDLGINTERLILSTTRKKSTSIPLSFPYNHSQKKKFALKTFNIKYSYIYIYIVCI
jgi:hypothetical protein